MNKGKYWDKAWSLVEGCTPVSAACENCWLAGIEYRFRANMHVMKYTDGISFTGLVKVRPDRLGTPMKTKKPTVWAVWSDLFHENVDFEFIEKAFFTMYICEQHTFLLLTKRPERLAEYIKNYPIRATYKNVYFGTTVESPEQENRITELLRIPGKKFLSIEPMLGPINLASICLDASTENNKGDIRPWNDIDWVIAGGESGKNARPMYPDWVRSVRDQCQAAGVPFFFKQWGNYKGPNDWTIPAGRLLDGKEWNERPF